MSDDLPFASVIVPMRNEAANIERCLRSLLGQDYPRGRMEIVVADGASSDGSREIVERIAKERPEVRLVDNPKRVIPSALNVAIRASRGTHVIRADCRSDYGEDYVRMCVHYLQRGGAWNVGGPYVTSPGADTPIAHAIAAITSHRVVMGGSRFRTDLDREEYTDGAVFGAWDRQLFERIGYFNEALERGEDNEFNSRILKHGGRILKTPRIVVKYRNRPTLGSFLRQTYGNGLWHYLTVVANPSAFKLRYFAPALFVTALIGSVVLSVIDRRFVWLLLAVVVPYLAVIGLVTVQIARTEGVRVATRVPLTMVCLHVVYGIATLAGFVRFGIFDRSARQRAREGSRVGVAD